MKTMRIPCPMCGAAADFISVTYASDANGYYYDIHLCNRCGRECGDKEHPLRYDDDEKFFIEVVTPAMESAAAERAGQRRLFE